ncbi:hypothetical protein HL658_10030 [Azospirillum sp. RWY-5-1]|uniref:Uncharacterized protein n=1 Tax=Azospirillum oleiclasticum TaxID=2735135 RepID=A0ABX2T8B8_9PROT|nr:hypothetical protein [Azospirillum oleiclasticum]NYZ12890.1 hypothetical protein [Azospirillum oleiclasticum]NYZ20050.1 hypothetical protein [Azospirillum oleiclasticum]
MFKVKKQADRTFWHEVVVHVPNDSGATTKVDYDIRFNLLTKAQEDELLKVPGDDYEEEWFKRHLCGWKRIEDEDGKAIEFSMEAALDILFQDRPHRTAILTAYHQATNGQRRKN